MKFVVKRFLEAIPVFLFIITAVWTMVRFVPGGPFDRERPASEETIAALNAYYGLDKPMYVQYFNFLKNLAHGDLGPSYKYKGWSVGEILAQKAVVSLQLGSVALVIAIVFGIVLGVLSATLHGVAQSMLSAGVCLPSMVLGPVLILAFSLKLGAFNAMGWSEFPSDAILPSITLALFYVAWIARLTRSGVADELGKAYVRTARAKGVGEAKILFVHILRNALKPTVSYLGPAAAGLLTGSFVVESIFQIPGLGKFFISSALDNDYTMILGCVLLYAAFIIVFNLLSDIILALMNPRIAKELKK